MYFRALTPLILLFLFGSKVQAQTMPDHVLSMSIQWWDEIPAALQEKPVTIAAPFYQIEQSKKMSLSKRWRLGADLRILRNARPYIRYRAQVQELIHCSLPVYVSFFCNKKLFVEGGIYLGTLLDNPHLPEELQWDIIQAFDDLNVHFDGGFVTSVGYTLQPVGKLIFRYNIGLMRVVPISKDQHTTNQLFEVGLTVRI